MNNPAHSSMAITGAARPEDCFEIFGRCLAPELEVPEITSLRIGFLSNPDVLARLIEFAAARDLIAAVEHCLSRYALIPPDRHENDDTISSGSYFRRVREDHAQRRALMKHHLVATVRALNGAGVEPLLLKGCASLWIDRDPWRHMRDMDIFVHPDKLKAAQDALQLIGFRTLPESKAKEHHLANLFRAGMPGCIEIHFRISNDRAERYIDTNDLSSAVERSVQHGGRAQILRPPHQALHGLVHNHFGHRSSSFGTVNLKGLHEFAWAVAGMTATDSETLNELSSQSTRLRATFELWTAAAAIFYRLRLPAKWDIGFEARRRAMDVLRRTAGDDRESWLTTFARESTEPRRKTDRERASGWWTGRLLGRLKSVGDAARDIVVPWRNREGLRKESAGLRR